MAFDPQTTTTYIPFSEELIEYHIAEKEIVFVIKRTHLVTNGLGDKQVEVIKKHYSRYDGSVKEVAGIVIPAQNETYRFEE